MMDSKSNRPSCDRCKTVSEDLKLLPCLHVLCLTCTDIKDESSRYGDTDISSKPDYLSIYACVVCGYKLKTPISSSINDVLNDLPTFMFRRRSSNCNVKEDNLENGNATNIILQSSDEHGSNEPRTFYQCADCQTSSNCEMLHCNETVRNNSKSTPHSTHNMEGFDTFIQSKLDYISSLLGDLKNKTVKHVEGIGCIDRLKRYLSTMKEEIEVEIMQRSKYLIQLVEERTNHLLREVLEAFQSHMQSYESMRTSYVKQLEHFQFVSGFTEDMLTHGTYQDIVKNHENVSNICLHQIHQVPDVMIDVSSFKLDIPGKGKEHSALEKLFGSLTEGKVFSGSAELVASFSIETKWPTGIGVSPSKEVVITGKSGAFETPGKAFFFDGRGRMHTTVDYDVDHIPMDIKPVGDGTFWLSNSDGQMLNMSVAGRVLRTVSGVFRGSGQLSVLRNGSLAVASSFEPEIKILDELGMSIRSIRIPRPSPLTCVGKTDQLKLNTMTTNSNDEMIIGDSEGGRLIVLDPEGQIKFTYPNGRETADSSPDDVPNLKCPSAVCCDPFDNILLADFTNDSVYLFSKTCQFLGTLLTKSNGLSCPTCIALDQEGKLYTGQYGGDILVFRYMSCIKRI